MRNFNLGTNQNIADVIVPFLIKLELKKKKKGTYFFNSGVLCNFTIFMVFYTHQNSLCKELILTEMKSMKDFHPVTK